MFRFFFGAALAASLSLLPLHARAATDSLSVSPGAPAQSQRTRPRVPRQIDPQTGTLRAPTLNRQTGTLRPSAKTITARPQTGASARLRLGLDQPHAHFHAIEPPPDFRPRPMSGTIRQLPIADLPFQAQDLPRNGRLYRAKAEHSGGDTWQQFAYDIGVAVIEADGRFWHHKPSLDARNPRNSDYYIDGVPVRAMTDGVITHCWRNAPDNPRPFSAELDPTEPDTPLEDQTQLHALTRAGTVFGSGNFVVVEEDGGGGTVMHYAHGQRGTMPERLCPHTGSLLDPANWMTDAAVPSAQQTRVRRGDILFLTGNSGTSGGPHLHVERTEADLLTSVPITFRHGLSDRLNGWVPARRRDDIWRSFADEGLPSGPVLIWPPRGPGGLWSWHDQRPENFNEAFLHMADSGYLPTWLDLYRAGGRTYVASVWRPARAGWVAHTGLDGATFQREFNAATGAGFRPARMDSHTTAGGLRYSAVFSRDADSDFVARHGQSQAAFEDEFGPLAQQGYVLTSASVVSHRGSRRYTLLYNRVDAGGWVFLPAIRGSDYQREYDSQAAAGRYPITFSAYRHDGRTYYAVVFAAKPGRDMKARHGLDETAYQRAFNSAGRRGIVAVAGTDGHSSKRYMALWR